MCCKKMPSICWASLWCLCFPIGVLLISTYDIRYSLFPFHRVSRGLGAFIFAKQRLAGEPIHRPGTPASAAYYAEHDYAVQWAVANR